MEIIMSDKNVEFRNEEVRSRPKFKNNKEKIRWYLDEIDCYKEDMGKWYSWFFRRIIPILVFFFPINIVAFNLYYFVGQNYLGGIYSALPQTVGLIVWIIMYLIFIAIVIFLPRAATFFEFLIGGVFFFFVFRSITLFNEGALAKPIITNALGFTIAIVLGIFLFMKLVFLVLEIVYHIVFRGEKEPKAYKDGQDRDLVL